MAPALNFQTDVVAKHRATPAAFYRALRQRGRHIYARQCVGALRNCVSARGRHCDQRLQMRGFGSQRVASRLDDAGRFLRQISGVEPNDTGQSLTVGKAGFGIHQRVGMFGRYLNMIAQHGIVPHLERGNACPFAILRLQRGDGAPPARCRITQSVERRIIARGNIAAARRLCGWREDQRARQFINQRTMPVQCRQQAQQQCGNFLPLGQFFPERTGCIQPVPQCPQIPRGTAPGHNPTQCTANIRQCRQYITQICTLAALLRQPVHQIEPVIHRAHIGKRRREIRAQHPRAGTSDRPVHRAQQASGARSLR